VSSEDPAVALAVSPHPDDELLGAGATLMALRDRDVRVVNLACSLGRPEDRERRRAELTEACRRASFELLVLEQPPPIGSTGDPVAAQPVLARMIGSAAATVGAGVVVGPSPHDGHPGHELVGRALRDAVEASGRELEVIWWGLWGELPLANRCVYFGERRLAELQRALAAHAGELARNRFDRLLAGRAAAAAVLGPERVGGFGSAACGEPYAELVMSTRWVPAARRWELDGGAGAGAAVGWWLHEPSARVRLAGA
jgi:LmbE family N-acetylglucosaminyl deacetylase